MEVPIYWALLKLCPFSVLNTIALSH